MNFNKIIVLFFLLALAGCSTPYLKNRQRDACDIFTATAGSGTGAKIRLGPINIGMFSNNDIVGLRGGQLFMVPSNIPLNDRPNEFTFPIPARRNWSTLCYDERFDDITPPLPDSVRQKRRKSINASSSIPFIAIPDSKFTDISYLFQLEIAFGAGGTIRIGFNPAELLDFLIGWTTLDILSDDIEGK